MSPDTSGRARAHAEYTGTTTGVLGASETWPDELRILAEACWASPGPTFILWGSDRVLVYNDALADLLGDAHPAAFGHPLGSPASGLLRLLSSLADRASMSGASAQENDTPVTVRSGETVEERFVTTTVSPARYPPDALFGAATDSTRAVLDARRDRLTRELAARLAGLPTAGQVVAEAAATLGGHGDDLRAGRFRSFGPPGIPTDWVWGATNEDPARDKAISALVDRCREERGMVVATVDAGVGNTSSTGPVAVACRLQGGGPPLVFVAEVHEGVAFDAAFRRFVEDVVSAVNAELVRVWREQRHSVQLEAFASAATQIASADTVADVVVAVEESAKRVTGALACSITFRERPDGVIKEDGLVVVPIVTGNGTTIGTVRLTLPVGTTLAADDLGLVKQLATLAGRRIVHVRRFRREYSVSHALQRSLLPDSLPDVAGMEMVARYQTAVAADDVGGDWYDALVLPDGRLLVSVGDAVGHDLRAAVAMNQIRLLLRARASDAEGPAALCSTVNAVLPTLGSANLATMTLASIEVKTGTATFVNAGHPLPILWFPGQAEPLPVPTSIPLGVRDDSAYRELTIELPPGGCLLLYTDGLIERRNEHLDISVQKLLARLSKIDLEDLGEAVDALLASYGDEPTDDVAVLALRRLG